MGLQPGQPRVEDVEAGDPVGDVGTAFADEARQFGGRLGAVSRVAPAGDPGGILERDIEPAQVDEQAQVLDILLTVVAVGVLAPARRRKPAGALVEADGIGRDADLSCQFADLHPGSKPWSGSDVKDRHGRVRAMVVARRS